MPDVALQENTTQREAQPGDWVILRSIVENGERRPVLDRRPQRPWFPTRESAMNAVAMRPDIVWIAQIDNIGPHGWGVNIVDGPFGRGSGVVCST